MPRSITLSPQWRKRLLITAALYFTFLGGTLVTDLNFWPRVAHHVIVTLLLSIWAWSLWRRGGAFPATSLDLPIAGLVASWVLATAFAINPRVSVEALWSIVVYVCLFYILVDLIRTWGVQIVLESIYFSAAVVVFVGLFEFVSWYFGLGWLPVFHQGWPQIIGVPTLIPPVIWRLTFTMSIATFLAGYLALLIPVALAWAITAQQRSVRQAFSLWIGGALIVLVLTFSRGGLLSLGVSLGSFLILTLIGVPAVRNLALRYVRDWRTWAALIPVVVGLIAVGVYTLRPDTVGHGAGDLIRANLLQSAWQIGLAHPLTGAGPYGFGRAMRQFRDPTVVGDSFTSSHSIPLQVFAEAGALGVVALGWALVAGGRLAWNRWQALSGTERVRVSGVIAALIGFTAQNLGDTLVNIPVLLPWMALWAMLAAPQPVQTHGRARRVALGLVTGFVLLSALGWAWSDLAQYHFNRAMQLAARGDHVAALPEITTATQADPAMGFYAAQQAQYLGQEAFHDDSRISEAIAAYQRALKYDSSYALIYANYAMLLQRQGSVPQAIDAMETAVRLQPDALDYQLWLAALFEKAGDDALAVEAYRNVLELQPDWAALDYWDATPLRSAARRQFMRTHGLDGKWTVDQLGQVDPVCWMSVPPLRSEQHTQRSASADLFCSAQIAVRIRGDAVSALPSLDEVLAADRANPRAYLLRAEANLALDRLPDAERDARIALFLGDTHAYYFLGRIAEMRGDAASAERDYRAGAPLVFKSEGWDVAVYQRRGDLVPLPFLDSPGPSRYDFAAWLALIDLLDRQGRTQDSEAVKAAVRLFDPSFVFDTLRR